MNIFEKRCIEAQKLMAKKEINYLFIGPGTDMRYLCNYVVGPMERLRLFVLPVKGKPSFITPSFEVPRFELSGTDTFFDLLPWEESENPIDYVTNIVDPKKPATISIDDKHWSMFTVRYLKSLTKAKFVSAEPVLGEMRMHKDATEIKYLKHLGEALDKVWEKALQLKYNNRKESELGFELQEIKKEIFSRSGEPFLELSFRGPQRPASGINSSSAHGGGSDKVIKPGDPIYWEIGQGICMGYVGDKTRSCQVAPMTEEYKRVYEVVKEAQQKAFEAVHPGVTCEYIDSVARQIIQKSGYGEYFTHRVGHGLGLDGHEPPWLVHGNKRKLEPGMVFTVEPGIYLPRKWGIRIEDTVYVTESGVESLYHSTKEFHEVR